MNELEIEEIDTYGLTLNDRISKDDKVNKYGKHLLQLCERTQLYLANGRVNGDLHGQWTYVSSLGSSVIDYIILSQELFQHVDKMNVGEECLSYHFPMELSIISNGNVRKNLDCGVRLFSIKGYKWSMESEKLVENRLSSSESEFFKIGIEYFTEQNELDSAVKVFDLWMEYLLSESRKHNMAFHNLIGQ